MKRSIIINNKELEIKEFIYVKINGNNIYLDKLDNGYKLTTTGKYKTTQDIESINVNIINTKHNTGIIIVNYKNDVKESHQVKLVITNKDSIGIWITENRAMYTLVINKDIIDDNIKQFEMIWNRED